MVQSLSSWINPRQWCFRPWWFILYTLVLFVDLVLSIDMKLSDVLNHFFDLKLLSLLVHSIRLVLSNIMVHSLMVILSLDGVHSWKVALSLVMIHFIPCGTISFHDSLSECGTNWCQGSLEAWFYHELWFSSWLRHYLFWRTTVSILVLSHFRVHCKHMYLSRNMIQSLLKVLSLRLIHLQQLVLSLLMIRFQMMILSVILTQYPWYCLSTWFAKKTWNYLFPWLSRRPWYYHVLRITLALRYYLEVWFTFIALELLSHMGHFSPAALSHPAIHSRTLELLIDMAHFDTLALSAFLVH